MAKIVFMGTPDFAVPVLERLIGTHDVIGVVTQPDRPAGRNRVLQESPVKKLAVANQIPVFQPVKIRKPEAIAELKQWTPDVYIVAAFGQILPQEVLDIPAYGSINVHASLLPRWRGAAPIHAAIRAGDDKTGITIMKMDAGLDTGPMLTQESLPIAPDETGQSLHDKLAYLGADLLIRTLPGYLHGTIQAQPQPEEGVTYAPTIKKEEGRIDWTMDAAAIERLVRAFDPWPGTYTTWQDKQLKILAGETGPGSAAPGAVIEYQGRVAIGTGGGLFYPREVQLAGRGKMSIEAFVQGRSDFIRSSLHP